MDNIITEVKVLAVNADNQQKCKIDADIPAFESSYDIRFITWWSDQGEPPKVGQVGTAELKATSRQKYFIKKGDLEEGPPDGTEKLYQLYWDMISFKPNKTGNEPSHIELPTQKANGTDPIIPPPAGSKPVSGQSGAVYMDGNARYRIDNLMKNARDAMWMVINHGATGEGGANLYADMESVVRESKVVRKALDEVLESHLGKPPVVIPDIKNSKELEKFTKEQGWTKAQIIQVLNDHAYKDSAEYLAVGGNSVMGLAELLQVKLG